MKYKYTRKELAYDLMREQEKEDQEEDYKEFGYYKKTKELPFLIQALINYVLPIRKKINLEKLRADLLYTFAFFASNHRGYKFNKGYLHAQISKFPKFIADCRKFLTLVLWHFNKLSQCTDIDLKSGQMITYDGFLQFKYSMKEKKWRAFINPDKLKDLARVQDDKAKLCIYDDKQTPIIVLTVKRSEARIDQITKLMNNIIK